MMIYLPMEDRSVYTVKDIYNKNKQDSKKMLSTYLADFWKDYRENSDYFDRRFMIMFKSFFPIEQETEEGLESVADDFRYDVYSHLMANDKRYSEIYRINTIQDDDAYSLTNNVDYTETVNETTNRDIEFNKGEQTDTEDLSKTFGQYDGSDTHTNSAYNVDNYAPDSKDDTQVLEHTDTEDNSRTSGIRQDTTDDDVIHNSTLHKVGNMGVQTVDDMLIKHWNNWNLFDFYGLIFKEIARDLLRGV